MSAAEVGNFDEKLRKAIQDLQIQTIATNQRLAEIDHTQRIMEQNIRVSEVAKAEVQQLPKDKAVYHNIGRVFVLRTHEEEIEDQEKDIRTYTANNEELKKTRDYLQKNLTELEKNVRDILQNRQ
ncbi:hypothetical protein M3Y94_00556400 [Aphelenchoides besseyi]|nr:hypothetical protein M3Y94_00556400 [Aphelenchoides besseyi]KAI6225593.1 hypothetical protein M3Y95_00713700 [Aphelenchoides besseyi]